MKTCFASGAESDVFQRPADGDGDMGCRHGTGCAVFGCGDSDLGRSAFIPLSVHTGSVESDASSVVGWSLEQADSGSWVLLEEVQFL
jgi:hypothetical protein